MDNLADNTEVTPSQYEINLKKRNADICKEWVDWHDRELFNIEPVSALKSRISIKYKITEQYIYQILRENSALLKQNKDWRKFLRICKLQRLQAGKTKSNKDIADLLNQERIEIEGDKSLVDQSSHNIIQFITYGETLANNKNTDRLISAA